MNSFEELLSKYHVLGSVLEVWDKEVIKIGMVPGFCRMHGLVGSPILNTSYTIAVKRSALGTYESRTKVSGDTGKVSLRKYLC